MFSAQTWDDNEHKFDSPLDDFHTKRNRQTRKYTHKKEEIQIMSEEGERVQKQPRNFFGVFPVARYLAANSSALSNSSLRIASTAALFSSASL